MSNIQYIPREMLKDKEGVHGGATSGQPPHSPSPSQEYNSSHYPLQSSTVSSLTLVAEGVSTQMSQTLSNFWWYTQEGYVILYNRTTKILILFKLSIVRSLSIFHANTIAFLAQNRRRPKSFLEVQEKTRWLTKPNRQTATI